MHRPLRAALALAALPLAALPLRAQLALEPGERVRVVAPALRGTFYVVATTRDSLVVQQDPTAPAHRLAVAEVERLHVDRGRRSTLGGFGRGFAIGGGIGAALGVVSGLASGDDEPGGWFHMSAEDKALGGGLLLGAGGGLVGGLIGALAPGERWERVPTGPRVALVAPPGGRGVGVRIAGAF